MQQSIFQKRLGLFRKRLKGTLLRDSSGAWIIQPENRRYLSGFKAEDAQLTESSGSLLIDRNHNFLITDSRYTLEAQIDAVGFEVQTLKEDLIEDFPHLVHRLGMKGLAFEQNYLTWGLHCRLREAFESLSPPVYLTPLDEVAEEMREVKDDVELRAIEASAALVSSILDEIIDRLKPGTTEREAAWQIEGLAREAGADGLAFPSIVASGPNSALPHARPTDRKMRVREPITLDVGVKLNGYCSDITRTVFLGGAGPELRKIYRTVRQAQLAAVKEVLAGVESNNPDTVARQIIRDEGFGEFFGHGLGHGVGLATHERPRLGPRKPVRLKKGMVVTVEPGIYVPGKGGVRLEEMVVIEEGGARVLTKAHHFYDFD
ncbi:MAG: aminopeptidase P family protein [Pseudomonadota bacterium]